MASFNYRRPSHGFTLIELLVVITILAILATVASLLYSNMTKRAQDARRKADINAIAKAYEANFNEGNSVYQLLTDTNFAAGSVPTPPEGGSYGGLIDSSSESFQVCAALNGNSNPCNIPSDTCYCKQSARHEYIAGGGGGGGGGGGSDTTAPATISNLSAGSPTSDTITLSWTAPGDDGSNGTATSYDIRYSTSDISTSWDTATQVLNEPTPVPAGTTQNFTVTGLNPLTTYYFAIKTADEVPNWSNLSNVVSLATNAEPPPPCTITTASWGSSSPVTEGASVVLNVTGSASCDGKQVNLVVMENDSVLEGIGDDPVNVSPGLVTLSGTSLTANWTAEWQNDCAGLCNPPEYYFTATLVESGQETRSADPLLEVNQVGPGPDTTAPSAVNLSAGSPTTNSITLNWTAPGDDGSSGDPASMYDIRYNTVIITDANWDTSTLVSGEPTPAAAGSSESFTLTGLNADTTYYFALKTADEVPNWSSLSNSPSATTTSSSNAGLRGDYYNNTTLTNPIVLTRYENIDFNWGTSPSGPGMNLYNISVRWQGFITTPTGATGSYSFCMATDDGFRLWVNNVQLGAKWWGTGGTEYCFPTTLNGGTTYPYKVEYFQGGAAASAKAYWTPPGQAKQVIPLSAFSH